MSRDLVWPKPSTTATLKVWTNGARFVLRGGRHDGLLLRLFPGPYADDETSSGWDTLTIDGEQYVRPHDEDPYRQPTRVNVKRTNVPQMRVVVAP